MAKQLNVSLQVQADTTQAKQALQALTKTLDGIIGTRTITVEDTSINAAKQAAVDLKHHLDAAVNVNTGKLDLSKFSASLNKSGQSLKGLYADLSKIGPQGQNAFLSLSQSIAKADASAISLGGKLGSLMTVLKNTARWQISSSILHGFMGSIQGAYHYAQDLNESLNNIRIVTGQNEEQMARFAKTANEAAKALSTTTTEYTNASLIYYQQGLSNEEVKARTDATIKLANVSRQSAEEVSDQMTAVWNNFAEGSDNLEYYIDVMAKLGATTASSTKEIATGLEKFAAVANTVGLSYEYATAALATVTAKTRQSADIVGTAFKTLFARLQDLELGNTLDDGTTLGKYSAALETVGVHIKDINGEVKNMDQILDELGSKWNQISKDEQIALAQTVAGTRQYTQLIALMDNWDYMQQNLSTVAGASGELQRQADIYAESWEAARDRVTAAAEEIYSQLLNDNAFIDILNGFEKFLNIISNVIDGLGGVKGILLLIGSIFMQQYAKEMPVFMSKMISNLQILTGAAEKQRQTMLQNTNDVLQGMDGGDSKGLSAQIIGMQKISEMYTELAEKRKILSSAEIAAYEQKIKDVEMYGQIAQAIGQEVDKLNEEATVLNRQASQDLSNNGNLNSINQNILNNNNFSHIIENFVPGLKEINIEIEKAQAGIEATKNEAESPIGQAWRDYLKELQNDAKKLTSSLSGKDLLKGFQEASKQVGKIQSVLTITSEKTKQWDKEIKNIGTDSKAIEKLKQEMIAYRDKLEEAKVDTKEIDNALKNIQQDGTGLKEVSELFADIGNADPGLNIANAEQKVEQYKNALIQLGVNSTVLDDLEAKWKAGAISTEQYTTALKQLEAQQKGNLQHGVHFSEVITQLGSAMMQVSMAINAIKNIGSIWSDKDMSTGEKILATMTAMGTLLPTLIGLYKTFTTLKIKSAGATAAETAAETVNTGAKIAEADATNTAAIAQERLNKAFSFSPAGKVLLIVTGLVTAFSALTTILLAAANAETKEEKAVRLANEQLEASKKAANEAKQVYEDLKNSITSYDSVIETLNKCVKGTQEWRDAFQEVLDKTYELIEKYPQLLQYENLFNKDGTLNQDVLQKVLQNAEQAKLYTQNSVLKANANKIIADFNLERTQVENEAISKFNAKRYYYDNQGNRIDRYENSNLSSQKAINSIITALQTSGQIINEENIRATANTYLRNNNINENQIEKIVNDLTNSMMPLADSFRTLGNEVQASANTLNNANSLIIQNLFGEQLENNPEKEFTYIQAYNERVQKELDDINNAIGDKFKNHRGGASDNVKNGKIGGNADLYEFFEDWKKATGNTNYSLVDDNAIEYYEGSRAYLAHTGNGDDTTHIKFVNMREDVAAYRAAQNLEAVMAHADEIFTGMSTRLTEMAGAGSSAMTAFLNNGNIGSSSVRSAEALAQAAQKFEGNKEEFVQQMLTGQTGEKGKKAVIQYLAKKYDITEDLVESGGYYDNFIRESTEALSFSFDQATEGLTNRVKTSLEGLKDDLDVDSLQSVSEMYTKALANGGESAISILDNIAKAAGEQAGDVMEVLAGLDIVGMDVDQVNLALSNLGINFKLTENQFFSFAKVLSSTKITTTEAAQETYKAIDKVVSGLKTIGDTIDKEAYEKLMELNPALSSYFMMMADGTYMLVGAVKDFQTAVRSSQLGQLRQAQMAAAETAMAYTTLQGKNQTVTDVAKNAGMNLGFRTREEMVRFTANQEVNSSITDAQLKVLEDNGVDTINWKAKIEAGEDLLETVFDINNAYKNWRLSEEDYTKKASEAADQVIKLNEAIKEAQYQNEIAIAGLDYETTEQYVGVLMELYEAEGMTKDQARELAIANQRLDKGLSSLNDNFEDWTKSLKNTGKNTAEYAQTIGEIREAFSDLLNIADADELSLEWLEQWMDDGEKMKKIMDGDQEAIQELRESAFTEMTANVFTDMKNSVKEMIDTLNESGKEVPERLQAISDALASGAFEADNLRAAIQDLSENEIGKGATLSQEYVDSLNQMLAQGLLTEQQLNDIFSQIGYKPKVTTATVDQEVSIPIYETREWEGPNNGEMEMPVANADGKIEYVPVPLKTKYSQTRQISAETMTQSIPVAQIESADTAGGNLNIVNAGAQRITPSHNSTTSGKKSGGGGGGKSPTKKASEKKTDETERYHVVRAQIQDLSQEYDKASKAKDRLFGIARVQMINKEIDAVDKLAKKQKQYLDEIEDYREKDFAAMTSLGKKGGIQYTAEDANGNQSLKTADVLGLKDWLGMDVITDPNGVITNYEEIMAAAKNWYNKKIDEYNAMSASQQEAADKAGWKNLVDGQYDGFMELLKQYEETNDLWETEFENLLEKYREKQNLELEKFQYKIEFKIKLSDAEIKRLEYIRKSLADDRWKSVEYLNTLWNQTGKNSTYQQLLEQGGIQTAAAAELLGASHGDVLLDANGNVISQPQFSDEGWLNALDETEDALYNNIDALQELDDEMIHYYEETLSNANEKLNQYMTKLEDCTAVLEHYKNITELINKVDVKYYQNREKLLKAQQATAKNEYNRAEQEYILAEQRYRDMLAEYENTDWTGNEAGKQKFEDQLQSAYEHMTEWQDKALSKAEALAEAIKAVYENAIEGASYEMEQALTGGIGFDELANSMDRAQQTSDLLLTKTNQIYETNKLMRALAQDIDKVNNASAKAKLKNFKDEIQDMQNMNEMTQFDLEVAKARYEILKAQIALEEAQNAKSIVRLQRDNEGNYGYVYTADQDKINDARQALEDKQNDLYNLTLKKANESAEALAQLDRDFVAEMNRINTEYANDEQKRQELLYQLREDYAKKREILERDSNTAYYWLNQTAATDSSEAWASAYQNILPKTEEWKKEAEEYIKTVQGAHDAYKQDIDENVVPSVKNLDQKIKDVTADSKKYSQWFSDFANNNDANLTAISDITDEYIKQRQEVIKLIQELQNYISQIDAARRAAATKEAEDQARADRASSSQSGTGNTVNIPSGTISNNAGGSGSGGGTSGSNNPNNSSGSPVKTDNTWTVRLIRRDGGYNYASQNGSESSGRASFKVERNKTTNREKYYKVELLHGDVVEDYFVFPDNGRNYKLLEFDSGGYTGNYNIQPNLGNGKLAVLHEKELVLNQDDTKNMLKTVSLVRQLSNMIDLQALTSGISTNISSPSVLDNTQSLEQMVTIHAEFPNATNHSEIEEAFSTLINRASQYANRFNK